MTEPNKDVTRRSVVKGAAWAVPAIAVAAAVPQAAASTPAPCLYVESVYLGDTGVQTFSVRFGLVPERLVATAGARLRILSVSGEGFDLVGDSASTLVSPPADFPVTAVWTTLWFGRSVETYGSGDVTIRWQVISATGDPCSLYYGELALPYTQPTS